MLIFYTLSTLILLSARLLVSSRNPLYSLLSLVVVFICGSLQLVYLGIDFIAYVFIIVYVGALAVLFLFVVIILDIKLSKLKHIKAKLPLIFTIAFICFLYLEYDNYNTMESHYLYPKFLHHYDEISCLKALGIALYTKYLIHFVLCGLVLLLAIIGAIVLTSKEATKKTASAESQFLSNKIYKTYGN